LEEISQKTQFN